MESSRMEATRVHRQSATTKSTETLGIHTCVRARVPCKELAICDTIHPPPSWRAARCSREAENSLPCSCAPVLLHAVHAGKTSALSCECTTRLKHDSNTTQTQSAQRHWECTRAFGDGYLAKRLPSVVHAPASNLACRSMSPQTRSGDPACGKDFRCEL